MEFITENLKKSTGVYSSSESIKNFKIRIKIAEMQKTGVQNYYEKEFSWQEKVLSKDQKEFYKDERNCFTELEKEFNRLISEKDNDDDDVNDDDNNDFLFTYCNEENFVPSRELLMSYSSQISYLEKAINNMKISISSKKMHHQNYDFNLSLKNSIENPFFKNEYEFMYIMVDFGEYFEDTWIKNEKVLCTLKYNLNSGVLQVFPDFTNAHPYTLQVENNDKEKIFNYFIEKCSNNRLESIETNEKTLIKKIHDPKASIKDRQINETLFKLPPKNKLYVFLFLEICYGKHFEYPEIYVEYLIQLPEGWSYCGHLKSLKGRTQLAKARNKDGLLHFGHCLEILLEFNFLDLEKPDYPNSPYIFFEVISKDSWDRYRTEGLCYISLPISHSGIFQYNLNCFRLTTVSQIGEMKRFFIGDCKNYTDITWIGINEECISSSSSSSSSSVLNKFGTHTVSTGILNIKLSTVHQSQEFLEREENLNSAHQRTTFERLGSTTLIKSVEQVIQEFKKARKEMLEAKKHV